MTNFNKCSIGLITYCNSSFCECLETIAIIDGTLEYDMDFQMF